MSHTPCLLSLYRLLLASLSLAHRCGCVPLWNRTTHSLLPCSSSSASCSLQGRLPILPQALFSIPHSPSPEGFKLFFHLVFHLCTHYRWVSCPWLLFPWNGSWLQAQVFGFWCAWRRKEFFWNLSPLGLPACLPVCISLPHPPHYLQLVFCFWVLVFVRAFRLMFVF